MEGCVGKKEKTCAKAQERQRRLAGLENMRTHNVGALTSPGGSLGVTSLSWRPVMWGPGLEIVWKLLDLNSGLMKNHGRILSKRGT